MRLAIILGICLGIAFSSEKLYSQTTDSQLAAHYYQNKEYGKAKLYYQRLYDKQASVSHYNYLYKCHIELKDFNGARKLAKQHVRIDPFNQKARVDLGYAFQLEGNQKQAEKEYKALYKKLAPNYQVINTLGESFISIKAYAHALNVYQEGRGIMKGSYPFNNELANVHYLLENYSDMTRELLDLLDLSPAYLKSVQEVLYQYAANEKESATNTALKKGLIQRINQQPRKVVFSEMLIWLYIQESNWRGALIQVKAIDKRQKERGNRVFNLAQTLRNNQKFALAAEAYDYIVQLGPESPLFLESKIGSLMARYDEVITTKTGTPVKYQALITDFDQLILDFGLNTETVQLVQKKAFIQCFYQQNLDSGLTTYEQAIAIPGVPEHELAQVKLEYADALLAANYIWDASLVYGQVDKAFKYDRLGEQAKFKGAKLHFYTGNFSLAKAQLDVLKGATTKLIANDAMLLSVIITDNSTIDTSTVPLQLYADADLLLAQNKIDSAQLKLDSIHTIFPGHALEDEVLMLRYEIEMKLGNHLKASEYLKEIKDNYSSDILADKAIFKLAELNEQQLDNPDAARELYQLIITDYQDSLYATESRKRFRRLRGDNL